MCLTTVKEPKEESGYAWKIVRKTRKPGVYLSYFSHFYVDGSGGCCQPEHLPARDTIERGIIYRDEQEYVVDHNRQAISGTWQYYPAGVHLYRSLAYALKKLAAYNDRNLVVKKFWYEEAVACDSNTMVAMVAKPLMGEEQCS